jgi:Dynamin family
MMPTFASHLDALGQWRLDTDAQLAQLARFVREHALLDDNAADWFEGMRHRLSSEKLMVAFVAEFSRGKSELINAIFFSDKGRRMMPASVGRTTMCPVELAYDADQPDGLSLLPIESRLLPTPLAELRQSTSAWTHVALDLSQPEGVAEALTQVMRTRHVSVDEATQLGFWDPDRMEDNPPLDVDGLVEVPLWRHARINLPHPLLKRGLVVLDTPGLNAVGAEPELTLGMLPQAHAIVFLLGADTGVTRSDLSIWRDHLAGPVASRFVVLNKIDTLVDPLSTPAQIQATIEHQRVNVAQTLGLTSQQVFPLSARQALTARLQGNLQDLAESRLPAFEQALSEGLLPQRRQILAQGAVDGARQLQRQISQRFGDLRRQYAEQGQELRGLRGKSSGKVQLMLQRIQAEAAEFEQCAARLAAMRNVHARMLKDSISPLSSVRLHQEVDAFSQVLGASWLPLGARKSFIDLCATLRALVSKVQADNEEIHAMLVASFGRLNADFGFALVAAPAVGLQKHIDDIQLIEKNYVQYLGLGQAIRLTQSGFQEQFRRMLISRLRVVFDAVGHEVEAWNKTASSQVDSQLRERRRNFKRRYESLERIQSASTELDVRLSEVQSQEGHVQQLQQQLDALVDRLVRQASSEPLAVPVADLPADDDEAVSAEHIALDFLPMDTTGA